MCSLCAQYTSSTNLLCWTAQQSHKVFLMQLASMQTLKYNKNKARTMMQTPSRRPGHIPQPTFASRLLAIWQPNRERGETASRTRKRRRLAVSSCGLNAVSETKFAGGRGRKIQGIMLCSIIALLRDLGKMASLYSDGTNVAQSLNACTLQ